MKQDVFPVGQGARKRRSQWLAFGIFKLLSYSIVLILFAILGFIIYKGIGVISWEFLTTAPSDGSGAIASGAIAESLILAKAAEAGINWEPGWIIMVTTTVKIFIDVFIGELRHAERMLPELGRQTFIEMVRMKG